MLVDDLKVIEVINKNMTKKGCFYISGFVSLFIILVIIATCLAVGFKIIF